MAEKQKVLMYFSYIGTGFWGSQYQFCRATGAVYPTVQNSVEQGLKKVFKLERDERPIIVRLCSRTDSGVHAFKAALTVDLPKFKGQKFLCPNKVKNALNKYFGQSCSIRIWEAIQVPESFTFRDTCLSKTYVYRLGVIKDLQESERKPFYTPVSEINRTYFFYPKAFDVNKVEEAMRLFVGEKDFAAVARKSDQLPRPTVCNILSFTIENAQPLMPLECGNEHYLYYHLTCKGTRFLYHMVRAMVGAVLSVGVGRTSLDEIRRLFEKPEPSSWLTKMVVVPACGLYLADTTLDLQKVVVKENEKCEADDSVLKNSDISSAQAA